MVREPLVDRIKLWTGITGIPAASSEEVMAEARTQVPLRRRFAEIRAAGVTRSELNSALKRMVLRSVVLVALGIAGCALSFGNPVLFGAGVVIGLAGLVLAAFTFLAYFRTRKKKTLG